MIDSEHIEAALLYLAKNVEVAAQAKAEKWAMEQGLKVKKAHLEKQCNETTEAARERYALAHPDYQAHSDETKKAIYEDAKHTFRRNAYEATIEAWRTQQATIRAAERVT